MQSNEKYKTRIFLKETARMILINTCKEFQRNNPMRSEHYLKMLETFWIYRDVIITVVASENLNIFKCSQISLS